MEKALAKKDIAALFLEGGGANCGRIGMPPEIVHYFNRHLLLNGVHLHRGTMGLVSAVHTKEDIDQTIEAFGVAFDGILAEGIIEKVK